MLDKTSKWIDHREKERLAVARKQPDASNTDRLVLGERLVRPVLLSIVKKDEDRGGDREEKCKHRTDKTSCTEVETVAFGLLKSKG